MEKYVLVRWPFSQEFMEEEWFDDECILMNDENHYEEIGPQAFFIPEDRYFEFKTKNKRT
jgi:hypothetical protein